MTGSSFILKGTRLGPHVRRDDITAQRLLSKLLHRFFLQLNGHPEQVCHLTNGMRGSICN